MRSDLRRALRRLKPQRRRAPLDRRPDAALPFTVRRVVPVAEARDGHMVFHVDARLDATAHGLRPGLEGLAKIEVGDTQLAWIWLRPLLHWLRIELWAWWP